MALIDILNNLAEELGLNLDDTFVKAKWIKNVNNAGEDIWNKYDIPGSLREQVFDVDITSRQLVLPYYVNKIRGVRNYNTLNRIKQMDMRPRYFSGSWQQPFLTWRNKGRSALCRDLVNESRLTLTIPFVETEIFSVFVEGSTNASDRVVEEVAFTITDLTKITTNQFTNNASSGNFSGVRSIRKSRVIANNLAIYDVNSLLVSEIANHEIEANYKIIQISDFDSSTVCDSYEILYKVNFTPFKDDYSTFPLNGADDPIFWKTLSRYYALKKDNDSTKLAIGYNDKANGVLAELTKSDEDQVEKEIQFEPNHYYDVINPWQFDRVDQFPFNT